MWKGSGEEKVTFAKKKRISGAAWAVSVTGRAARSYREQRDEAVSGKILMSDVDLAIERGGTEAFCKVQKKTGSVHRSRVCDGDIREVFVESGLRSGDCCSLLKDCDRDAD